MKLILILLVAVLLLESVLATIRYAQRARKLYAQPPVFKYAPRRTFSNSYTPRFTAAQLETMLGVQNKPKHVTWFDDKFDDEATREY